MAIQGVRLASSNYLATAASTWFQPGRTLTVMCWARPGTLPPTSNYYTLLGTTTSAGVSGWGVSIQGGAGGTAFWEMFFTNNGSNYDDFRFTNGVLTGRWDHVAWVMRSDATQAGFLNGVQETLVQSSNAGTYPAAASRALQIKWGDATGNGSFDGALGYVRIFDGELSAPEIRAEMCSRRAVNKRVHCIADYPLEALGGTASIVAPDVGPQGLPVTTVTGTVVWYPDPPTVRPVSTYKRARLLGQASSSQAAALGTASETDTAIALTRRKARALGIASETDTAGTVGRAKRRALGIAAETDTAQTLTRAKARTLGVAAETDTAVALARRKARQLGVASEADTASSFAHGTAAALGIAAETDTAVAFTRAKRRALGVASTTDTAGALTSLKRRALGVAGETDVAVALGAFRGRLLGIASEGDTALTLGRTKRVLVGVAAETDSAGSISPPDTGGGPFPTITHVAGPQRATAVAGGQRGTHVAGPQRATNVRQ
jgi:hypothetical protein